MNKGDASLRGLEPPAQVLKDACGATAAFLALECLDNVTVRSS